jgi:hypothetical protein
MKESKIHGSFHVFCLSFLNLHHNVIRFPRLNPSPLQPALTASANTRVKPEAARLLEVRIFLVEDGSFFYLRLTALVFLARYSFLLVIILQFVHLVVSVIFVSCSRARGA